MIFYYRLGVRIVGDLEGLNSCECYLFMVKSSISLRYQKNLDGPIYYCQFIQTDFTDTRYTAVSYCINGNPLSQNFGVMTVNWYYFRNCDWSVILSALCCRLFPTRSYFLLPLKLKVYLLYLLILWNIYNNIEKLYISLHIWKMKTIMVCFSSIY